MLPWEAKARTLNAPVDDVSTLLELLGHEGEVSRATAGLGPDDVFFDVDDRDPDCPVCNPFMETRSNGGFAAHP